MSKEDFDSDLKRIIDEVQDLALDDHNVNIEDILNENDNEYDHLTDKSTTLRNEFANQSNKVSPFNQDIQKHPLKVIEDHERDITSKLGGQADLDSKFLLMNYLANFIPKFSSVSLNTSELITKYCFPEKTNFSAEDYGTPKCISVLPSKYIAVGTSHAIALVYDYIQSKLQKFGTPKEQEYGTITSLDISSKDDCLVCGYESGHITLWDIVKGTLLKTIVPTEKNSILVIKFWKEFRNHFLASDTKGNVFMYKIDSLLFQLVVDKKVLLSPQEDKKPTTPQNGNFQEGFFTIEVLKKELTEGHGLSKFSLVAIASMKAILVITLEPTISKVFKYERPNNISPSFTPCIAWGKGAIPNTMNQQHPLLAISWGTTLDLFQFYNIEEEHSKGVRYVGTYQTENEIQHMEFISENNILLYDTTREFKLACTYRLKPKSAVLNKSNPVVPHAQTPDLKNPETIVTLPIFEPDVSFQIYHEIADDNDDMKQIQKPILFYNNTIKSFLSMRRIYILGFNKVYIGKHLNWKEQLDFLKSRAEWLPALSLCVSLYKGDNIWYADLPLDPNERKNCIRPYSSELIRDYITSISKVNGTPDPRGSNDIWQIAMLTAIDFLVSVENFEFLFVETKYLFEAWDMRDRFVEALEAFILRNRIKFIPNEPLRDLVKHYISKRKIDVLQYLIVNLSLNDIDMDYVITICMEYNLLTALLYLCSHREGVEGSDFLTPIARCLSTYQRSLEQKDPNTSQFGYKFLWFLRMVLEGRMFPFGKIQDDIWPEKVKDVVILLFDESNMDLLLQIDPFVSFEILQLFFEQKLTNLLDIYDEDGIQLISDLQEVNKPAESANSLKRIGKLFLGANTIRLQAQMLALVYYCAKKKENFHNMLFYTLADLKIHSKISLPVSILRETLFYIVNKPKVLPTWKNTSQEDYNEDEEESSEDVTEEKRGNLILSLLKTLKGNLSLEDFAEIEQLLDKDKFLEVKAYLLGLDHQYKRIFDMFLHQESVSNQKRIFKWLQNVIPYVRSKHPDDFQTIKESILYRLKELVTLSSEQTRQIVIGLDQNLEIEAIKQLNAFPNLQLDYIKGIFKSPEENKKIPDALLVLHIKLLCQLQPKQVIKEVKFTTYPLDECLKLCREYDVKNALAFFLERAGNLQEAINISLELFRKSLEKNLLKIEKEGKFKKKGGLIQKLNTLKEICIEHNKIGDPDSEQLWFSVLDSVVECYHDYIANNKSIQDALKQRDENPQNKAYKKLYKVYSDFLSDLFEDMSKYVSVESILVKLETYSNLKLGDLKSSILSMLEAHYYENNILSDARALVVGDNFDNLTEVTNVFIKGVRVTQTSAKGQDEEEMVIFNCGHTFPKSELKSNLCNTCSIGESLKVESVILNAKKAAPGLRSKNPLSNNEGSSRKSLNEDSLGNTQTSKSFKRHKYLYKMDVFEDIKNGETLKWNAGFGYEMSDL